MLAYHSIEHMGLIALGAAAGIPLAIAAVLLHILGHGLAKSVLFLTSGEIMAAEGTSQIDGVRALLARRPALGGVFGVGLLALLGFPPFSLFASELAMIRAEFQVGLGWAAAVAMVAMVVIFIAVVGHARHMLLGAGRIVRGRSARRASRWHRSSAGWRCAPPSASSPGRSPACSRRRPARWRCEPIRPEVGDLVAVGRRRSARTVPPSRPGRAPPRHSSPTACASPSSRVTTTAPDAGRLPLHRRATRPPGRAPRAARSGPARGADLGRRCPFRPAASSGSSQTSSASSRSATPNRGAWSCTSTGPRAGIRCATVPERRRRSSPTGARTPSSPVEGTGVYEIPVGPVHAGLIEPGHFRFWVVGETILRMKARLWFVHKGIERHFQGQDIHEGLALAERISGDTAVGHALAYCQAVEDAWPLAVTENAGMLRAALLELERLYNHVADIGALCNDVGFGLAQAWALDLREHLLRLNRDTTGHRLLRGGVVMGGAAGPLAAHAGPAGRDRRAFRAARRTGHLERARHGPLQRRGGARPGRTPSSSEWWAPPAGRRASTSTPASPTPSTTPVEGFLACRPDGRRRAGPLPGAGRRGAGVAGAARALCRGCRRPRRRGNAPGSSIGCSDASSGVGIAEGWRGAIVHRVEIDDAGRLARVKVVDPSFFNWPALPVSLADTIVPDFPLANKSFNLSYAGNDL